MFTKTWYQFLRNSIQKHPSDKNACDFWLISVNPLTLTTYHLHSCSTIAEYLIRIRDKDSNLVKVLKTNELMKHAACRSRSLHSSYTRVHLHMNLVLGFRFWRQKCIFKKKIVSLLSTVRSLLFLSLCFCSSVCGSDPADMWGDAQRMNYPGRGLRQDQTDRRAAYVTANGWKTRGKQWTKRRRGNQTNMIVILGRPQLAD